MFGALRARGAPPSRRRAGFTLAELVIIIVIGCIGTAIFFLVVKDAIRRSKTAEASYKLTHLYEGAAAYYRGVRGTLHLDPEEVERAEEEDRPPPRLIPTAPAWCTVGAAETTRAPGDEDAPLRWSEQPAAFRALDFHPEEELYYQYQILNTTESCGHTANEDLYVFRAVGDLDGDGTRSLFEISTRSDEQNRWLLRTEGIYYENELE